MPPKVGRRPAARGRALPGLERAPGRGALRRPAAAGEDHIEAFNSFREVRVSDIPSGNLLTCGKLWVTEAHYWKEPTQCAGHCKGLYAEDGELWVEFLIEGTKREHLLKYAIGIPSRRIKGHICRVETIAVKRPRATISSTWRRSKNGGTKTRSLGCRTSWQPREGTRTSLLR